MQNWKLIEQSWWIKSRKSIKEIKFIPKFYTKRLHQIFIPQRLNARNGALCNHLVNICYPKTHQALVTLKNISWLLNKIGRQTKRRKRRCNWSYEGMRKSAVWNQLTTILEFFWSLNEITDLAISVVNVQRINAVRERNRFPIEYGRRQNADHNSNDHIEHPLRTIEKRQNSANKLPIFPILGSVFQLLSLSICHWV
jgi:hypothetical protein